MCDGIKLICNEAGEWEKYDDTWDITIHCRDEQENEKIRAILTNLNLSGWIATKDKLPEKFKTVLCWVRDKTIAGVETYILGSQDNGCWFLKTYDIGTQSYPVKDYEVVAWRELPEPYVEVEK